MLTTPPLSPLIISTLQELGIFQACDINKIGVLTTFILLKQAGLTITNSVLWSLISVSKNIKPADINENEKKQWLIQLKQHAPVALFPKAIILNQWMGIALQEARKAFKKEEVPVGAVVVYQEKIIGRGYNQCIVEHSPIAHAEIQAIKAASDYLQNYRLDECDLYVTLEPCLMCSGAIIQARIKRLIYGASEPKTGCSGSVIDVFNQKKLNNHTAVLGGIAKAASQALLNDFFKKKRV